MAKRDAVYEPMTLGNREHGMTRLDLCCHGRDCWHRSFVDVSAFADDLNVAELRFWCLRCGSRNVDGRPDWIRYAEHYRAMRV